jgi:hypothetical protein
MQRRDFFSTPIYLESLPQLLPHREAMIGDVMGMVQQQEVQDRVRFQGLQTRATLFERSEPWWGMLRDAFLGICEKIEEDQRRHDNEQGIVSHDQWVFARAKCWAYIQDSQTHSADQHTHFPNRWSAVYYLKLPPELEGVQGGTTFDDPRQPITNDSLNVRFEEGDMCIFPSWLRHAPILSPNCAETRITLAMDALYLNT